MNVPTLEVDRAAKARGWRPTADHLVERWIVWTLLNRLLSHFPSSNIKVDDGEETTSCGRDPLAAMEIIFNLDDCFIHLDDGHWIRLICGNGMDIVSDYGAHPVMDAAMRAMEQECGIE